MNLCSSPPQSEHAPPESPWPRLTFSTRLPKRQKSYTFALTIRISVIHYIVPFTGPLVKSDPADILSVLPRVIPHCGHTKPRIRSTNKTPAQHSGRQYSVLAEVYVSPGRTPVASRLSPHYLSFPCKLHTLLLLLSFDGLVVDWSDARLLDLRLTSEPFKYWRVPSSELP